MCDLHLHLQIVLVSILTLVFHTNYWYVHTYNSIFHFLYFLIPLQINFLLFHTLIFSLHIFLIIHISYPPPPFHYLCSSLSLSFSISLSVHLSLSLSLSLSISVHLSLSLSFFLSFSFSYSLSLSLSLSLSSTLSSNSLRSLLFSLSSPVSPH